MRHQKKSQKADRPKGEGGGATLAVGLTVKHLFFTTSLSMSLTELTQICGYYSDWSVTFNQICGKAQIGLSQMPKSCGVLSVHRLWILVYLLVSGTYICPL